MSKSGEWLPYTGKQSRMARKNGKKFRFHKMNREMHLVTEKVQVVRMDSCKHV